MNNFKQDPHRTQLLEQAKQDYDKQVADIEKKIDSLPDSEKITNTGFIIVGIGILISTILCSGCLFSNVIPFWAPLVFGLPIVLGGVGTVVYSWMIEKRIDRLETESKKCFYDYCKYVDNIKQSENLSTITQSCKKKKFSTKQYLSNSLRQLKQKFFKNSKNNQEYKDIHLDDLFK